MNAIGFQPTWTKTLTRKRCFTSTGSGNVRAGFAVSKRSMRAKHWSRKSREMQEASSSIEQHLLTPMRW